MIGQGRRQAFSSVYASCRGEGYYNSIHFFQTYLFIYLTHLFLQAYFSFSPAHLLPYQFKKITKVRFIKAFPPSAQSIYLLVLQILSITSSSSLGLCETNLKNIAKVFDEYLIITMQSLHFSSYLTKIRILQF